jgi:uncharacterized glyoxalase superfamily protein PhnB
LTRAGAGPSREIGPVEEDPMLEGKLLPMLYVRDVPRSVAFYRDVLGFEFKGWWDEKNRTYVSEPPPGHGRDFAELTAGDLVLHLHLASTDQTNQAGSSILHLKVKDTDAYYEEVTARGGRFDPPRDQVWGWRQFYVRDPDGHRWSFSHLL